MFPAVFEPLARSQQLAVGGERRYEIGPPMN
jgi:hypothetical protein